MGALVKTVRRTRRTVRTAGLVAVAAAAAFSLTACGSDAGTNDDAGSSSSSKEANSASKESGSTGGSQDAKGGGEGVGTKTEAGADDVKRTPCTVATSTVRLQQTGGSAPVILLKTTNRGDDRCDLYGYPFVGYPDAQSPIAVGGGQPQAVVSLEPGKSAYAALSLEKGNGNNMHREKKLTVEMADRNQHGTGATATLNAPGAGLALSDNSTVSYWNTTIEGALQ